MKPIIKQNKLDMSRSFKILSSALATFLLPQILFAAGTADAAPARHTYGYEPVLIGLISLIVVLLFAIGVLGNILRQLAFVYGRKLKQEKKDNNSLKGIVLLLVILLPAYAMAQETAAVSSPAYIGGIKAGDFYLLTGVICLQLFIILGMLLAMRVLVGLLSGKQEIVKPVSSIIKKPFWDRFNKAVAVEKEQDIMLDHDYDGIRELDNSLPPWWKYGFYLTILIAIVYIWYYHAGGSGPSSYDEYVMEMEAGEAAKAAYLAKSANNIDESTVTMLDASGIAAGQNIFQNTCAACHAKDGGGGVGPNLTDDYWLHGGGLRDVFKTIKYGWPDKGMKSWKDDFSPRQIAELASFVKSLKGTHPASPKEKQGDLYMENTTPAKDSTGTIATN